MTGPGPTPARVPLNLLLGLVALAAGAVAAFVVIVLAVRTIA